MGIYTLIRYAVDKKLLIANLHLVTSDRHDPLNKVFGFIFWIDKNNHVIRVRSGPFEHQGLKWIGQAQSVGKLADQNMIPNLERRQHGAGWNFERLNDKTPNKKRQQ